ncbi:hypothetical protein N431DRAFT_297502, partial [Stipitochalara longipes BDJ]
GDLERPCHGWPALVRDMVKHPGIDSFSAFRDLNIKSLLYYQAELVQLRKELHALEWEDHRQGGDSAGMVSNIQSLLLTKMEDGEAQRQFNKMREIRLVLKEYNAALLQYTKINTLPKAETFNVKRLRSWIVTHFRETLNLRGPGSDVWGPLRSPEGLETRPLKLQFGRLMRIFFFGENSDELDLVLPRKTRDIDSLPPWVGFYWTSHWTPFWRDLRPFLNALSQYSRKTKTFKVISKCSFGLFIYEAEDGETLPGALAHTRRGSSACLGALKKWISFQGTKPTKSRKRNEPSFLSAYNMRDIVRGFNYLATIIACLLPIVGIVVLSRQKTLDQVLGYIAIFTAIFAFGILLLSDSNTSRTDIFTATAAFAAVLVVFVHNQNIGSAG